METKIQESLEVQQKMLDRGIIATPIEEVLDMFAQSNNGANDFLLMQMAKNYGYQLAINNLKNQL